MSTVKTKKVQLGTDATASNNFTIYQPSTPDGTLRIGVGNADSPTEVGKFDSNGYVATNAPAFSVGKNVDQTIATSTTTKVTFEVENWDLTNDYDISTSTFTPSVAGYYQFNCTLYWKAGVDNALVQNILFKNGSSYKWGGIIVGGSTKHIAVTLSAVAYANGTTDYFNIYLWQDSGSSKNIDDSEKLSWWDGHLVRAV